MKLTAKLIIIFTSLVLEATAQYGISYREPKLECSNDGIRLYIQPLGQFTGHVYVKGFFFSKTCHLDYCQSPVANLFSMDIPYRGDCNVRRHHASQPASVTYEATVIVQHHPLFVTAGDRAYRVNCVYRQMDSHVSQNININELSTEPVSSSSRPSCGYEVLSGNERGPPLRYANVGDPVVHKWSCQSTVHGFLVHSCVVRNDVGEEYKLVDERGCVVDSALVPDLSYSSDLSYAFTTIRAFRFADQIMVHFACQITLCRKEDQGCEGIAPPTCRPMDFQAPIHTEYKHSTVSQAKVTSSGGGANSLTTPSDDVTSSGGGTKGAGLPANGIEDTEDQAEEWRKVVSESIASFGPGFSSFTEDRTTIKQPKEEIKQTTRTQNREPSSTPSTTTTPRSTTRPWQSETAYRTNAPRPPPTIIGIRVSRPPSTVPPTIRSGSSKWANGIEYGSLPSEEEYGLEIVNVGKGASPPAASPTVSSSASWRDHDGAVSDRAYRTQFLSATREFPADQGQDQGQEDLPLPAAADIYYANRKPRSNGELENITMEVEAKEFIVFASESPMEVSPSLPLDTPISRSTVVAQMVWICAGIAMQLTLLCVILIQRHRYQNTLKRIKEQSTDVY